MRIQIGSRLAHLGKYRLLMGVVVQMLNRTGVKWRRLMMVRISMLLLLMMLLRSQRAQSHQIGRLNGRQL